MDVLQTLKVHTSKGTEILSLNDSIRLSHWEINAMCSSTCNRIIIILRWQFLVLTAAAFLFLGDF